MNRITIWLFWSWSWKKLGYEWSDKIYHLSWWPWWNCPKGRWNHAKARWWDADELMDEMFDYSPPNDRRTGKDWSFNSKEAEDLYRKVSLGALKYFMLKVDPAKNMMFNPKESIDFNGNTGPFVQYTYARVSNPWSESRGLRKVIKNTFCWIN